MEDIETAYENTKEQLIKELIALAEKLSIEEIDKLILMSFSLNPNIRHVLSAR